MHHQNFPCKPEKVYFKVRKFNSASKKYIFEKSPHQLKKERLSKKAETLYEARQSGVRVMMTDGLACKNFYDRTKLVNNHQAERKTEQRRKRLEEDEERRTAGIANFHASRFHEFERWIDSKLKVFDSRLKGGELGACYDKERDNVRKLLVDHWCRMNRLEEPKPVAAAHPCLSTDSTRKEETLTSIFSTNPNFTYFGYISPTSHSAPGTPSRSSKRNTPSMV